MANRPTSIGASCKFNDIKGHGNGRTTRRTTRNAVKIFGVMSWAKVRVFRGRTVCKGVKIGATNHDSASFFELFNGSRINWRLERFENFGRGRGMTFFTQEIVLQGIRNASERTNLFPGGDFFIDLFSFFDCLFLICERDKDIILSKLTSLLKGCPYQADGRKFFICNLHFGLPLIFSVF